MIGKSDEYERMFNAERKLWWYKILHRKTSRSIEKHFGNRKDIDILDAGCGTGGLLISLQEYGFSQIEGFDFSEDGVAFSQSRGLEVIQQDLTKIEAYKPSKKFDVIICNDVFTYFSDKTIIAILQVIKSKLKPDGIFITNNNAHAAFAGVHDILVGGQKRFVKEDMLRLGQNAGLQMKYSTYWSLFLSPPIMIVRAWQRFQIKRQKIDFTKETSDVAVPPGAINQLLYGVVRLEEAILKSSPFGSSIFVTMCAEK